MRFRVNIASGSVQFFFLKNNMMILQHMSSVMRKPVVWGFLPGLMQIGLYMQPQKMARILEFRI